MKPRKLLYIPFFLSAFFFAIALCSNWFYSGCTSYENQICTNNAQLLAPIVFPGGHWLLGFYPASISDANGQVAGLGLIGMLCCYIALKDSLLRLGELASISIILMTIGFAIFEPFCLVYACRVTNYIRFLSYWELFEGAVGVLVVCIIYEIYLRIPAAHSSNHHSLDVSIKEIAAADGNSHNATEPQKTQP